MNAKFFCVTLSLLVLCCGCGKSEPSVKEGGESAKYERMEDPEYRKALDERLDGRMGIQNEIASAIKELASEQEKDPASPKVKELQEKIRQLEGKAVEYRRQTQEMIAERMRKETESAKGSAKN